MHLFIWNIISDIYVNEVPIFWFKIQFSSQLKRYKGEISSASSIETQTREYQFNSHWLPHACGLIISDYANFIEYEEECLSLSYLILQTINIDD